MISGGVDTGWTFYTPYSTIYSNSAVLTAGVGIFIAGFSSILTGLNFIVTIHKMRAPGHDLVPPAAVRLGALRHQPDPDPGHAGGGRDGADGGGRAGLPPGLLRPARGRRPGAVPAPVLVLLAPGRVRHDPAGHGRDQRAGHGLLAQAHLRLPGHRHLEPVDRRDRLPGLGPPHVRLRAVGLRRHGLLVPQLPGGHPLGHQGLQLDRDVVQGLDLAGTRRCSTPSASSGCSPSAA